MIEVAEERGLSLIVIVLLHDIQIYIQNLSSIIKAKSEKRKDTPLLYDSEANKRGRATIEAKAYNHPVKKAKNNILKGRTG